MKNRVERLLNKLELPFKKAFFNCRNCGSCLLTQTALICPMNCPKGLRNGPCGGTVDNKCEVYPDKPCVWTKIESRLDEDFPQPIHAPISSSLLGTSSYYNFLTGIDVPTRKPIPFLERPKLSRRNPRQTASSLEKKLLGGSLVLTTEIRSPSKSENLPRIEGEIRDLLPWIDAFNATSNHGGGKTISSLDTARLIQKLGGNPILQICGRDVTPEGFLSQVSKAYEEGINDVLCLTGDWPLSQAQPAESLEAYQKRFFPMDSSQMVYELYHLRKREKSAFADLKSSPVPRFYIGTAANPHSFPQEVSISRLVQKIVCGVDFVQTQVVTDAGAFCSWVDALKEVGYADQIHLLASIPIITTVKALELVRKIKGVHLSDALYEKLKASSNISEAGLSFAKDIMRELLVRQAVHGFHLTNFGATTDQLIELVHFAKEITRTETQLISI